MKFDVYATADDDTTDPDDGAPFHHVERYTTREGTVSEVRRLLWQGRSVQVIAVPDDAPPPGGAGDPLDIPPFLRRARSTG